MTEAPTPTVKLLRRTKDDSMIAGVCGGLARYFDINPLLYRVGFVVLALLGGAGILIYGAAILIIPEEGSNDSLVAEALRKRRKRPVQVIALAILASIVISLLAHLRLWPHGDIAWVAALGGGFVLLFSFRQMKFWHNDKTAGDEKSGNDEYKYPGTHDYAQTWQARAARRSLFPVVFGLLIVGAGVLGILIAADVEIPWGVVLASAAVGVGAILVIGHLAGFRGDGLGWLGVLLALLAVFASTVHLHLRDGMGNRDYTPQVAAALRTDYRLGIGKLNLDLEKLTLPAGTTTVHAELGVGHLLVTVPDNVTVQVDSHVTWGASLVFDQKEDGHNVVDTVTGTTGAPTISKLVLDVSVGAGKITVVRAVG